MDDGMRQLLRRLVLRLELKPSVCITARGVFFLGEVDGWR
jgi:hypothetical protein